MTDRDHHDDEAPCLAFACEGTSRDQTILASATIASAADAMCHARGVRPHGERLALVARAGALRSAPDLAAALAAEGLPAPRARALAPHIERTLARASVAALAPDRWVGVNSAHGVPTAEHPRLLQLGRLAIEAAAELARPRPVPVAVVHLEPRDRSPESPWPGIIAANTGLFGMDESQVGKFLVEVSNRLAARHAGVRTWLPASGAVATTIAVRVPARLPGLPLWLAPFVVNDPDTLAELEARGLPDSALPGPVLWLPPIKE